jgi:hypothetical protein
LKSYKTINGKEEAMAEKSRKKSSKKDARIRNLPPKVLTRKQALGVKGGGSSGGDFFKYDVSAKV